MSFGPDLFDLYRNDKPEQTRMSYCPACGTIGYEGEEYCFFCGHGLTRIDRGSDAEGSGRCDNCSAPLPHPIACYCGRCGAPIERATADS